jgi:Phospholipase_D-nuclease N-terminal
MVVLSLGEFLWSLLVIFFMIMYFMMLIQVIMDVFRRRDASGAKKGAWLVFLFIIPFISLIAYMVTNSEGMAERAHGSLESRGHSAASGNGVGPTAEISNAKALLDSGAISQDEYQSIKSRVLA